MMGFFSTMYLNAKLKKMVELEQNTYILPALQGNILLIIIFSVFLKLFSEDGNLYEEKRN